MKKYIMVGCDLHDSSMVLRIAHNEQAPQTARFANDPEGRKEMIEALRKWQGAARGLEIVFAYEASAQGFGLYDELTEEGIGCYVLAPTRMKRSVKSRKQKCDEKDAQLILEILRGHLLAGNPLPSVWVPDAELRDDREVVRGRLDATDKATKVRAQTKALLKRNRVRKPPSTGSGWTRKYDAWLWGLVEEETSPLGGGARTGLRSLLEQGQALEKELKRFDQGLSQMAASPRYQEPVRELLRLKGVGVLTALVFLTELGDPHRFDNRREVGAYFGLVPSRDQTGEGGDHKGHITKQGSPRVRKVLGQAVWSRVRTDENERQWYQGVAARNPQHKKIAVVGAMRRLAIVMWHAAQRTVKPTTDPGQLKKTSTKRSTARSTAPACLINMPTVKGTGKVNGKSNGKVKDNVKGKVKKTVKVKSRNLCQGRAGKTGAPA